MKISIIARNLDQRGPGKVYQNLMLGLNAAPNITVTTNQPIADRFGYLQDVGQYHAFNPHYTLFGPNLFVLPSDNPTLCSKIKHLVVPSQWVLDLYRKFQETSHINIYTWAVGIDTKLWKPNQSSVKDLDCFIYFKNRTEQELDLVKAQLDSYGMKYEVISYGSYKEDDLYKLCNRVKFAILLTGTESQGIAYMEILSMNIPCYVFDKTTWTSDDGKMTVPATSVPYFTEECGVVNNTDLKFDPNFALTLDKYSPRKYIEENHGIIESAKKYFAIIRNI